MSLVSPDATRVMGAHLERVLERCLAERQSTTRSLQQDNHTTTSWDWYAPVDDSTEWEARLGHLVYAPWMLDVLRSSSLEESNSNNNDTPPIRPHHNIPFQANISASQFCRLAAHLQIGFGGWVAESNWHREDDVFYDVKPLLISPHQSLNNNNDASLYFDSKARERVRKRTSQGVEWHIASNALWNHHPNPTNNTGAHLNTPLFDYLGIPWDVSQSLWNVDFSSPHNTDKGVVLQGGGGTRVTTTPWTTGESRHHQLEETDDVMTAVYKQSLMTCTCASFANKSEMMSNKALSERALVMACVRRQCADTAWFDAPSTSNAIAWAQWFGSGVPDVRLELSTERATQVHLGRTDSPPSSSTTTTAKRTSGTLTRAKSGAAKRAPSKRTQATMATLQPFPNRSSQPSINPNDDVERAATATNSIHLNYGNAAYVAAVMARAPNSNNVVTHKHRVEALARIKIRKSWVLGMMPLCGGSDNHNHHPQSCNEACVTSHFEMCKRPCWRFDLTMSWSAKNRVAAEEMFCAHLLQDSGGVGSGCNSSNRLSTRVPPSYEQTPEWLECMARCAAQLELEVECIDPLYHGVWLQYTHGNIPTTSNDSTPLPIGEMLVNQLLQHVVNLCSKTGGDNGVGADCTESIDADTVSPALFSPVLLQTTSSSLEKEVLLQ